MSEKNTVSMDDEKSDLYLKALLRVAHNEVVDFENVNLRLEKFENMAANILTREGYPGNWVELCNRLDVERDNPERNADWWPTELVKLAYHLFFTVGVVRDNIKNGRTEKAVCWTIDLCNKAATIQYLVLHKKPHEIIEKLSGRPRIFTEEDEKKVIADSLKLDNKELAKKYNCSSKTIGRVLMKK